MAVTAITFSCFDQFEIDYTSTDIYSNSTYFTSFITTTFNTSLTLTNPYSYLAIPYSYLVIPYS